jgi:2,4-dienoyl-CoA reductase-like NADH-dependent reductase (Old Yellow Enzyme family)
MSEHEPFAFRSSEELLQKAADLKIEIPFQVNLAPLFHEIDVGSKKLTNRFAVQPMEGYDALPDGSPNELTFRRYKRYAQGGSALIWFEATSVVREGRSNPRQLWMHADNVDNFSKLVAETRNHAIQAFSADREIYCVLQLTHSGRYSRPEGRSQPQVAILNPFLDENRKNIHVLSDKELDELQDKFILSASLASQAGFDAVDIKACHGYVVNELLAAYERQNSRYGGSFENRIRFLLDVIGKIRKKVPAIGIAVRMNAYDGLPYPYGFGSTKDDAAGIDLSEPERVLSRLIEKGCSLLNITAGIPNLFPHFGRPFDRPLPGAPIPPEHPLQGVYRLISLTADLQKKYSHIPLVGTGYSWLRQFFPHVGAAVLENEMAGFVGMGRSAFAYPEAPLDLVEKGKLNTKKVCISCSRCSEMMRMGGTSGCVMKDKEIYGNEYAHLLRERKKNEKKHDRS